MAAFAKSESGAWAIPVLVFAVSVFVGVHADFPVANLLVVFAVPLFYLLSVIGFWLVLNVRGTGKKVTTILSLGCLGLVLWPSMFGLSQAAGHGARAYRLLFANMFYDNKKPELLLAWIGKTDPDTIVLVESGPTERRVLGTALSKKYRQEFFYGETHVFSKYPFKDLGYHPIGHTLQGLLVASPLGPIDLEVVHLSRPWPFSKPRDARQNTDTQRTALIDALATYPSGNMIVLGDFNGSANGLTAYTLRRRLQLRAAPGAIGTWPSILPGLLRVNFDNVLTGKELVVTRRMVGPPIGSDHRPIIVDIAKP